MRRDGHDDSLIPDREASLMSVFAAALLFLGMTAFAEPPWISAERGGGGTVLLTLAHLLPLVAWTLSSHLGFGQRLGALLFSAAAGCALFLHFGLSDILVADLDAGDFWSKGAVLYLLEIVISIVSLPLGLWALARCRRVRLMSFIAIPTAFGAGGQVLFFLVARLIQGPSGLEFWMAVRILIMAATGLTAGFFTFADTVFRPQTAIQFTGGFTAYLRSRFPSPLPAIALVSLAIVVSGALRVIVLRNDRDRFVTVRLDDYFLSLSNLTSARSYGLLYAELTADLAKKRSALFGAAAFDPVLVRRLHPMLSSVESRAEGRRSRDRFENDVMAVNRRLLDLGEPYFLEPHSLGRGGDRLRFVLRYRVVRRGRYGLQGQPSVPMLRLRRLDDILVDTPYTGLSYANIGTILMDHIEAVTLTRHVHLFAAAALAKQPSDGKWAATLELIRKDARAALEAALTRDGYRLHTLQALAQSVAEKTCYTVGDLRQRLDTWHIALFDRMVEQLALETAVHETRHATDSDFRLDRVDALLSSLTVHDLEKETAAEVRAYLTEIIDGPLGPKFTLATLGMLIVEPDAGANAYFFAAIIIFEGLWGEKVRRPDIVEVKRNDGVREVVMPISKRHPGWLSFSRIHGAYADLTMLSDAVLRERAAHLFVSLFDKDYSHVERRR